MDGSSSSSGSTDGTSGGPDGSSAGPVDGSSGASGESPSGSSVDHGDIAGDVVASEADIDSASDDGSASDDVDAARAAADGSNDQVGDNFPSSQQDVEGEGPSDSAADAADERQETKIPEQASDSVEDRTSPEAVAKKSVLTPGSENPYPTHWAQYRNQLPYVNQWSQPDGNLKPMSQETQDWVNYADRPGEKKLADHEKVGGGYNSFNGDVLQAWDDDAKNKDYLAIRAQRSMNLNKYANEGRTWTGHKPLSDYLVASPRVQSGPPSRYNG